MRELAEKQIETRKNAILTPKSQRAVDSMLDDEVLKGEIAGIQLFLNLPQIVVDGIEAQTQQREEMNDGNE